MKLSLLMFFLFSVCFFGCTPSEMQTVEELNKFVADSDNNLIQEAIVNTYKINVSYRPTDLLVEQEIGNDPTDQKLIEDSRKKFSNYYYFVLSLSKNNKEALNPANGWDNTVNLFK